MTLMKPFIYKTLFADKLNHKVQRASWILCEREVAHGEASGSQKSEHRLPLSPVLLQGWTPLPWKYRHLIKNREQHQFKPSNEATSEKNNDKTRAKFTLSPGNRF